MGESQQLGRFAVFERAQPFLKRSDRLHCHLVGLLMLMKVMDPSQKARLAPREMKAA
jgi:hypothetical protein